MKTQREFVTRKEIASRLGMSVEFVRKNEVRLGFRAARVTFSARCVRYRLEIVEAVFASIPERLGALGATKRVNES